VPFIINGIPRISAQPGGVVNASGTNQPADGTYLTNDASRRTFLKGVGLAGAAGLAAGLTSSLLATPSARASGGIILGVQAPGPWDGDGTRGWTSTITAKSINSRKVALGCRSYRDAEFNLVGDPNPDNNLFGWWNVRALGSTTGGPDGDPIFPGEPGSIPLASIRPQPSVLLDPSGPLDGKIKDFILDGARKAASGHFVGTPQLTAWHEAGHLYQGYAELKPDQDFNSGNPTNGTSARTARLMHIKMQNLVKDVNNAHPTLPNVEYGCIIYGDVIKMANDNDPQGPTNWVPTAASGSGASADGALDWYGIDLYFEPDPPDPNTGAASDCTHPLLADYTLVRNQLNTLQAMASGRANGKPLRINICECNAKGDAVRPLYFENLAQWLILNAGYRMLTFFPDPAGHHSVTWFSVASPSPDTATVSALNDIQHNYGR
jgi:hypothetical protein